MAIMALGGIFRQVEFPSDSRTLMILSTTKGNIDLLTPPMQEKWGKERSMLWKAAQMIADFWGLDQKPRVISNACVSGVEAIHFGAQFIKQGLYENVLVVGADMLTEFVVSGFMSFQSLSSKQCKPFDEARDGLNLGEAAAAMWLTSNAGYLKENMPVIEVLGGASSNDANHISGPSRTGDGQFFAIDSAMKEAGLMAKEIDYISAHGTATPYNDEMESKALNLAGLHDKPVNSMKAYFGHTLGAAGVLESVVTCKNLRDQKILKSLGYQNHGVPLPLNVITETKEWPMKYALKTASGFGGCNAAVIFSNSSRK
jgi:3-oxoacyl-[acyl-carrier-protein] synthase-1